MSRQLLWCGNLGINSLYPNLAKTIKKSVDDINRHQHQNLCSLFQIYLMINLVSNNIFIQDRFNGTLFSASRV